MRRLAIAAVLSLTATLAQAETYSLTKLIAADLAKRRGMIAIEDGGEGSVALGARYSTPACRDELTRSIEKGRPLPFGLVDSAPTLDSGAIQTTNEESYHLDKTFTSRNKGSINLLAKLWNLKSHATADFIRNSNISFKVTRKSYPASKTKMDGIGPTQVNILMNTVPPTGTVSTPYEILLVSDFTFTKAASADAKFAIAAAATEKAKVDLELGLKRGDDGNWIYPNNSAVAFKPIVVWDRPDCN